MNQVFVLNESPLRRTFSHIFIQDGNPPALEVYESKKLACFSWSS